MPKLGREVHPHVEFGWLRAPRVAGRRTADIAGSRGNGAGSFGCGKEIGRSSNVPRAHELADGDPRRLRDLDLAADRAVRKRIVA